MSIRKALTDFRPRRKGFGKVLGRLEAEVMEVVWSRDGVAVRDVFEILQQRRPLAYTTIMTIMSRLAGKGILGKEKKGTAYFYTPIYSREEFARSMVGEVLDGLWEEYAELAFSHFVQRLSQEDHAKIQELERIIQARRKEEGRGDPS